MEEGITFRIEESYIATIKGSFVEVFSEISNRKLTAFTRQGYLAFKIKNKTKFAHHIVTENFLGKRPPDLCVNHKDGNKLNNDISNLEYITWADNTRHSYRTGLHTISKDVKNSPKYIDGRCSDRNAYKLAWYHKNKERISQKSREKYRLKKLKT